MCLLDEVESWDALSIHCRTGSHRQPGNPLRAGGRLGAACGIEYAAQAMAIHGALLADPEGSGPRAGFLLTVRNVRLEVSSLDDITSDLLVHANCTASSETASVYEFRLTAEGRLLVSGRATVVLDADSLKTTTEELS